MMDRTGADGVMIARGAVENPFLFSQILGDNLPKDVKDFMKRHLILMQQIKGEKRACLEFRKFVSGYLKGRINIKNTKLKLLSCESVSEILHIIDTEL